jgi:hypothetical protein
MLFLFLSLFVVARSLQHSIAREQEQLRLPGENRDPESGLDSVFQRNDDMGLVQRGGCGDGAR